MTLMLMAPTSTIFMTATKASFGNTQAVAVIKHIPRTICRIQATVIISGL
jgi:hypothetical protein